MSGEDRQDWTQEGTFVAADGEQVRAYDDIVLTRNAPQLTAGSVSVETIPAGSQATVLFFTTEAPIMLDLECYLPGGGFAFAHAPADCVRLALRGEEKQRRRTTLETIDHVQVAMPAGEEDKARSFYERLLGLPEQQKPPELAKRGGCWFESARVKVHCGVETPFSPAKKAHIAFRVDDVPGLAARARAAGYEVVDDDLLEGHERIYIYDPFGNRLEFLRPLS